MTARAGPPAVFEDEFIVGLTSLFQERIPFNRELGLRIDTLAPSGVTGHLAMRPELIGHYAHQRLHGGVISAALDAMAGIAVMAAIGARHMDEPPAQRMHRFARLGTIDLRIDYLRPALGDRFVLRAEVLRLGSRVASTRMQFADTDGKLLATGSSVYIVA